MLLIISERGISMKGNLVGRYIGIILIVIFGTLSVPESNRLFPETNRTVLYAQIITSPSPTPPPPIPLPEELPASPYPLKGWQEAPDHRTVTLGPWEVWGVLCYGLKRNDKIYREVTVYRVMDVIEYIYQERAEWDLKYRTVYRRPDKTYVNNITIYEDGNWLVLFKNSQKFESMNFTFGVNVIKHTSRSFFVDGWRWWEALSGIMFVVVILYQLRFRTRKKS